MQSLKALTTFGADGGPGYAAGTQFYAVSLFLSISYNIEKWELIMIISCLPWEMKLRNPLVNRATFQAIHDQQLLAAGHRKGSNLFTQTKDHLWTMMLFVSVDNGITIVLVKAFCILYVCANLSFYL